ncbi:restriction endonuclease subunit S [Caldifermentibacillus hisashii]|uniref:restriction endonuclease subunit S n=1 Tax=Caldifermentibacillus hisashii TaxID=996558 RepID=UPI0022B9C360|nr:restriction endonuclease subunit S [Caldifermentibacillus hisashii]
MTFKLSEIGLVPVDWEISELKTKATITMGQSPKSDSYNSECIGMPFMQGRKTFGDKYHSIDTWCTDPKKIAKRNDVLISVRAPVGDVNVATTDLCIGRGLASLRMHNGNNEFLYYLLKNYSKEITNRETGTVFASINKKGLETIKLPFPSDIEQKAIANILSTLDEKIETNNQINEKLEEMAQALFKHWFVDFEFPNENGKPYKSSGGEMVESELGEIPKGWKVDKLSSIAEIIMGQSPKSDTYNTDKIGLPLLNGATDFQNKNLSPSKYTSDPKKVGEKGDFVFGVRATIGLVTELDDRYAIGRGSGIARAFDNMYKEFLYEILNIAFSNFQYTASGSVYLNVSKNDLEDYKLVIPDINILRRYHKITKSILNQKENLKRENSVLEKLQDTLLPKLMSGEIRVPLDDEVLSEKN